MDDFRDWLGEHWGLLALGVTAAVGKLFGVMVA